MPSLPPVMNPSLFTGESTGQPQREISHQFATNVQSSPVLMGKCGSHTDLPGDVRLDPPSQLLTTQSLGQQEDEFGIESFEGHVVGADGSSLGEGMTRLVSTQQHVGLHALGSDDDGGACLLYTSPSPRDD